MAEIIKKELYGGEVKIDFYPNSHQYRIGDKKLISVTGALGMLAKPALIYWAANTTAEFLQEKLTAGEAITSELIEEARKQHTIKKNEAATIGSLVHQWAEEYIKTGNQEMPEIKKEDTDEEKVRKEKIINGILAFLRWVDEHKVEFLSSERMVFHRKHGYVGIMDAEAKIDGKRCVVDFKTSSGIWPEYRLQVAAYRAAAECEDGVEYETNSIIARFDKESGEFEVDICENHEEDFEAFRAALNLKCWEQLNKKPYVAKN